MILSNHCIFCCVCECLVASVVSDSLNHIDCSPPGFSVHEDSPRQEYWSGFPCPAPGDLPNPRIKPRSPALQADSLPFFTLSHQGSSIICSTLLLCLQSFPASESFPVSQLYTSGGKSGASVSASVLPMNIQGWFPLELTGLISWQSQGLSRLHLHDFHQRFLTVIQGQKRSGLKFNDKSKGLLCLKFFLRSLYVKWMRWPSQCPPSCDLCNGTGCHIKNDLALGLSLSCCHLEMFNSFCIRRSAFWIIRSPKFYFPENIPWEASKKEVWLISYSYSLISWEDALEPLKASPSWKDKIWVSPYSVILCIARKDGIKSDFTVGTFLQLQLGMYFLMLWPYFLNHNNLINYQKI